MIWRAVFAAEYVRLRDGARLVLGDEVKTACQIADEALEGLRTFRHGQDVRRRIEGRKHGV